MNTLVLVAILFSVTFTTTQSLSCFPCNMLEDECIPVDQLDCKGGLAWGVCGCCQLCAKTIGEACGGPWGLDGTCDDGLTCVITNDSSFGDYLFGQTGTCVAKMTYA